MSAPPIVCPFCPLHCHDLVVDVAGNVAPDCGRAAASFHAAWRDGAPRIDDRVATEAELCDYTLSILRRSGRLRVWIRGTDLDSARLLERLRCSGRITLRSISTETRSALRTAIGRDGTVTATLGDIREHADLIWTVGSPHRECPRLLDRIIDPGRPASRIDWEGGADATSLAELSLRLFGRQFARSHTDGETGGPVPAGCGTVEQLFTAIANSRYVAVIVGHQAWQPLEATASAVMLNEIVIRLNEHRRAVLLHLDPASTNRAVTAWSSNRSIADATLTTEAARDVVSLGDCQLPAGLPVALQVGGVDGGPASSRAFMPASVAGVHRRGAIIRGDGTVTLPLAAIRNSARPTPARWLWSLLREPHQHHHASTTN